MIKENELRIGNLFLEKNSKETIEVIGLEANRIIFSGMFLNEWQAEPIKLTPEWLIKFGFEKDVEEIAGFKSYDYYLEIGDLEIYCDWDDGKLRCLNISNSDIKINYVHQLQNLYFALTGEELKINN